MERPILASEQVYEILNLDWEEGPLSLLSFITHVIIIIHSMEQSSFCYVYIRFIGQFL